MDHPQRDVSREQQHNHQLEGILSIPNTDGTEARLSTGEEHQHPSYLQQEETQLKQAQVEQDLPAQKNELMETQQSEEIQKQEDHRKITDQKQELSAHHHIKEQQIPTAGQAHQSLPSSEQHQKKTFTQNQSEEIQKQEDHRKITDQKQELSAHHHIKEQQIPTAGQAHQSLPSSEQHQKKTFTQNQKQPQKLQPSEKEQQQRQQEQQIKKLKKKLVGENQERINFLVQASQAMALTADSSDGVTGQWALAAQVGSLAGAVGRRCVLRLAPALKRCLCKGCGTALVYGLNARVRHRSRRQKHLVVTCLTCHTIKRFINDPKHKLWFEQEEALA
ncbi:putative uncharacterized protein DDB_G0271606 [Portunus trituberculatus]|uniref:putative uncharacterized protein DDB_G0271606 n=1 Tax=Portunus trituberculatus TaxID=210409 RepID=UPI001E1CDABB|nr:putative uncharacterized protein DDB_G0271606 [Portunus trituberculatus]XP_045130828.1 putative uncharacterized protein DDB_G0271606 [Portunus trituberculatus]XP_045130829.1 putative uncharacterized protein DDB_G0271606 [Portunus trituberculatus]XP_045130830.1 putative uncharacterized protein DDB_G0271606 [Portunus trituberculatus]